MPRIYIKDLKASKTLTKKQMSGIHGGGAGSDGSDWGGDGGDWWNPWSWWSTPSYNIVSDNAAGIVSDNAAGFSWGGWG